MSLWVPPKVSQELLDERARREAAVQKVALVEERWKWKKEFDAQLDRIVEGMQIVFCPDPCPLEANAAGLQPGRWNLVWPGYRGGPLNVKALEDDSGAFVEPGSWVFDMLAREDMWNERATRERNRIKREADEAKARRVERERAARDQDMLDRYLAATRTFVSMDRSQPWTQNASGRKARKQA